MDASEIKFIPRRGHVPPLAAVPALSNPADVQLRFARAQQLAKTHLDAAIADLKQCLALAHDFRPARELLHELLKQQRPGMVEFAQINIEVTNKCSNRCYFCPRDQLTRQQGVMSFEDFVLAVDRIIESSGEYVRRIDVQSFGESVLDKDLPRKIRHLKAALPYAYVTLFSTVAMPLQQDYLLRLLDSGLDEFVISLYAITPEDYEQIYGYKGFENMQANLSVLAEYNKLLQQPVRLVAKLPHPSMYSEKGLTGWREKRNALIEACQPHGFTFVESEFTNFGDGRDYNEPSSGMCSIIQASKRGMVIAWNLDITPCCIDFNNTMPLGNLRTQSVREIFRGQAYRDFVQAHLDAQLEAYPVCAHCDLKWDLESSGREAVLSE